VPRDLAEHVLLAHAPRDKLRILRTEVEYEHKFAPRSFRRVVRRFSHVGTDSIKTNTPA
jgi:hypothetical protein